MTVAEAFDDNLWRDYVNGLEAMDELGKNEKSIQNSTEVEVQKITTTVYLFYDTIGKKKFNHQASMKLEHLGSMPWEEAKEMVRKRS